MKRRLSIWFAAVTALFYAFSVQPAFCADSSTIIFVVDASGSMRGEKIVAAKTAISSVLNNLPVETLVGLVTFSTTARLDVPPTADRQIFLSALRAIRPNGNTALYDAIELAKSTRPNDGAAFVIALTDGEDTSSRTSISRLKNLQWEKTQLSVVGVDFDTFEAMRKTFSQIVNASNGLLISVEDTSRLADALRKSLSRTGVLLPETQNAKVLIANRPIEAGNRLAAVALALLLGVGLLGTFLSAAGTWKFNRTGRLQLDAIAPYRHESPVEPRKLNLSLSIFSLLNRSNEKLSALLRDAGLDGQVSSYRIGQMAVGSALFFSSVLFSLPLAMAFLIAVLVSIFLPSKYLKMRASRRRDSFEMSLPDFLAVSAGAMRAGLPFSQSIETAARDQSTEIGKQMQLVIQEMRVGYTVEKALGNVARRMQSDAFQSLASAIEIQRRTGGNLSEILDRTAQAVRSKIELRQEIRALAAEGLLSAKVLTGLPVGLFLFLVVTRREFVEPLWQEPMGLVILGVAALLILIGYQWIARLSKMEV